MISYRTPEAKADPWNVTDTEARKSGEQTGLDTLVVPTLNGAHSRWPCFTGAVSELTR